MDLCRDSVFKTTLLHMTEQFNGKEVFLVGSCNQSTMLAQRTQKLIEQVNPDAVLVQTSPEWWEQASLLRFVDSQEEMNQYNGDLDKLSNGKNIDFYWSNRRWVFLARFYSYYALWMAHFRFGHDFKMFRPGLEAKFACEAAERVGARLDFLGPELDHKTWERLYHETRMNVPEYCLRRFQYRNTEYASENMDN
jgi:pheromone shutdown protein TraB